MRFLPMVLATALAATASTSEAGLHYCDHCGCRQHCKKVCRLVCGKKKENKTIYECKCEDFCVPGPSVKCGQECECNRLGIKCCHAVLKPVCAQVRTKKVLVKKQSEKEVPDYKWVVEKVCCHCGQKIKDDEESGDGKEGKSADAPPGQKSGQDGAVKMVSAEEDASQDVRDGDYEALASDSDGDTPAVETPKRLGWLQTLFSKK